MLYIYYIYYDMRNVLSCMAEIVSFMYPYYLVILTWDRTITRSIV